MSAILKTLLLLTLIAIIPVAVAQSGRPLNSIETAPGTSVPAAPTELVRPIRKSNDSTVLLNGSVNTTQETARDAGSSEVEAKPPQKKLSK